MAWVLIVLAGLLEVGMALSLKGSNGFTHLGYSVSFLAFAVASFGLLSLALKQLEVGTAYAVWVGIGAVGTAVAGIFVFNDALTPVKAGALLLILIGVATLNLTSAAH